ncbi:nucleoid occlusion protein [Caldicoprobacter sp.]|uniref:nucleoid occlusion protein n=1 Tax=Caldicoprobacter sp. TaxID=2004500 RepID=UPI0039C15822
MGAIEVLKVMRKGFPESYMMVQQIPIDKVRPNPYQPRKEFSKQGLEELSESIKQYGVLQPITVRKIGSDGYELIAGERRLRACQMIGMKYIPAIVLNISESDSAIVAMIENLQRENLHYLDEAMGYACLIHDHGFTQEELARKIGKNQSTIANKMRLLKLPDNIKKMLLEHNLTERHARALLRLPDDDLKLKVLQQVISKKYNVKETEMLVEKVLKKLQSDKVKEIKHKRVKSACNKDMRIFINTIKRAVSLIKEYGLNPQMTQIDNEDSVEIIVKIPKYS